MKQIRPPRLLGIGYTMNSLIRSFYSKMTSLDVLHFMVFSSFIKDVFKLHNTSWFDYGSSGPKFYKGRLK